MATTERRRDRALERAVQILRTTGDEIRLARRAAGLSQRAAAQSVGLSTSAFARIEGGRHLGMPVRELCLACAAVGLDFGGRSFPAGRPARDHAQLALLGRLRARTAPSIRWRYEVPVAGPGDWRAWDAAIATDADRAVIDADGRLWDIQARTRDLALKHRDSGAPRLILAVADTAANRRAINTYRDMLRPLLPLDTRAVLAALGAGRIPEANGLVIL